MARVFNYKENIESVEVDDITKENRVFGEHGQISIVGRYTKSNYLDFYVFKCTVCEKDPELFGDAHFLLRLNHINRGILPCGCAKMYMWSKEQYDIICRRKCDSLGIEFIKLDDEWKGKDTKVVLNCQLHGEFNSTIHSLRSKRFGCRRCYGIKFSGVDLAKRSRKPDNVMIESFMSTGAFIEGTEFYRSVDVSGYGSRWKVFCPVCRRRQNPLEEH